MRNDIKKILVTEEQVQAKVKELAKQLIGKECLIYTFNGTQLSGVIKEVVENAILIEKGDSTEVVNLDFVVRIREYPKKKNGKKKSIVID